ncbi:hypothetical protein O9992_05845 [Vibrio lentus]|nr:hypothetical protein [Vibrio lentus]
MARIRGNSSMMRCDLQHHRSNPNSVKGRAASITINGEQIEGAIPVQAEGKRERS